MHLDKYCKMYYNMSRIRPTQGSNKPTIRQTISVGMIIIPALFYIYNKTFERGFTMFERMFKVSNELKNHIRVVLTRLEIRHKFVRKNDQWYCATRLSGEKFHKIVQRAMCEKRSEEDGILYLTFRESQDPILVQSLLKTFKSNGFCIIGKPKQNSKNEKDR